MTVKEVMEAAVEFTFAHEGGYSDHPADRGGKTKYGISARSNPGVDVASLTPEQAKEIYRKKYWNALPLDRLAESFPMFAVAVFDTCFNMGPGKAKALAQKAAGAVPDGIWGPRTWQAFAMRGDEMLAEMLCFYRRQRYEEIILADPSQAVFRKGWMRRVSDLQEYVRSLN